MKKIVIVLSFLFVTFFINAQSNKLPQEIKEYIQARIDNNLNVGVTIGLIDGKKVDYYNFGKTASIDGKDVDENTVFEIGSISKVFTTILLANKIKTKEMKLDDPISKYLPETVKVPTKDGKVITLKHLATHTSGLPRMPSNFAPKDPNNPFVDYSYEQLYAFLSSYTLTKNIGVKSEYSNLGMGLLGHILELQSGKTYEQLVKETIAKPLEMEDTALTFSEGMKARLAKGHISNIEVGSWDIISLAGAGGLRSTTSDMVKFVQANTGTIKSNLLKVMQLSHQTAFKDKNDDFELGLGWHFEKDNQIVWHNGQTGGYNSFIGFLKGTEKGVVVLSNSTENIAPIGFNLLGMSKTLKEIKASKILASEILETYIGKYQLAPNFIITVTRKDKQLFAQVTGQSNFEVYASSENEFFYKVVNATLTFNKDTSGKVESLTLRQNGQTIPGKKIE